MLAGLEGGLWQQGWAGEQLSCGRVRAVLTPPSSAVCCFTTPFHTAEILMVKIVVS